LILKIVNAHGFFMLKDHSAAMAELPESPQTLWPDVLVSLAPK